MVCTIHISGILRPGGTPQRRVLLCICKKQGYSDHYNSRAMKNLLWLIPTRRKLINYMRKFPAYTLSPNVTADPLGILDLQSLLFLSGYPVIYYGSESISYSICLRRPTNSKGVEMTTELVVFPILRIGSFPSGLRALTPPPNLYASHLVCSRYA